MNEGVMSCRLYGIFRKMQKGDTAGALSMIKDTMDILMNAYENELSTDTTIYFYEMLKQLMVDISLSQYGTAHDRLREMVYLNTTSTLVC